MRTTTYLTWLLPSCLSYPSRPKISFNYVLNIHIIYLLICLPGCFPVNISLFVLLLFCPSVFTRNVDNIRLLIAGWQPSKSPDTRRCRSSATILSLSAHSTQHPPPRTRKPPNALHLQLLLLLLLLLLLHEHPTQTGIPICGGKTAVHSTATGSISTCLGTYSATGYGYIKFL
jgi:hypothetical protein